MKVQARGQAKQPRYKRQSHQNPLSKGKGGCVRVTLARIYVSAGMKQSGLAEFERAATLAPKDDTIRDWIRRLKRGEA